MQGSGPPVGVAPHGQTGFRNFDHGAADLVLAAEFNASGTHLAVCSADHKIRVFAIDQDEDAWILMDQWRGHDAEISDASFLNPPLHLLWIGSSLGHAFGTIGDDNKFKLWREDPSQAPQSGRRFRCIFSQSPPNHVSYVSFNFKTVRHEVWLAIVSRDGLLSLLEPSESESLRTWKELDSIWPFGQHVRGSEPTFRLSLHQAEKPSYSAITAGLDPKAISLSLSAANSIKIFRATRSEDGNFQFYEVLELSAIHATINDVAWAPGSVRPYDLIAAACDDGCVRVYEITTPPPNTGRSSPPGHPDSAPSTKDRRNSSKIARHAPSGIGAGLAGYSRAEAVRNSNGGIRIPHSWKETAKLDHEGGSPVWRVRWTHEGEEKSGPVRFAACSQVTRECHCINKR
ncbi:MAG: hypothetical protein Q9223_000853 [Gallowayella weberi]